MQPEIATADLSTAATITNISVIVIIIIVVIIVMFIAGWRLKQLLKLCVITAHKLRAA